MKIERVYQSEDLSIYHGNAEDWPGEEDVDLVLTNPYGPLPASLARTPMLVHQWEYNRGVLQRWIGGAELSLVSAWNNGRECFWSANMPPLEVDLSDLRPEDGGWYPLELPLRLLRAAESHLGYDMFERPTRVWDGFMGRGTVAKACRELGLRYVGVEQLGVHIDIAVKYLEIAEPVYVPS